MNKSNSISCHSFPWEYFIVKFIHFSVEAHDGMPIWKGFQEIKHI